MDEQDILGILKDDLMVSGTDLDDYLTSLINSAQGFIKDEGIVLDYTKEPDAMLCEMYAAYLYRKRREDNAPMPRSLRWALNNRKFAGG